MGLDVYLYKLTASRAEYDRVRALNRELDELCNAAWEFAGRNGRRYEQMTEAEKDECSARSKAIKQDFAAKHGVPLGDWGLEEPEEKIELPSKTDPEHYFKIGYFRSSYNAGGIDHILGDRIGVTLSSIMGAPEDGSNFTPDWQAARARAVHALDQFLAYLKDKGGYRVVSLSSVGVSGAPTNEQEALERFHQEREKKHGCENYSNINGEFALGEPMQVVAIMPAKSRWHTAYAIVKSDEMEWYVKALRIVIETCDYVLSQPDPTIYFLHWSG